MRTIRSELSHRLVDSGEPRPVIRWSKVDGVMSPDARIDGQRLFIPQLKESDQGTYRCVATSAVGSETAQIVLTVEGTTTYLLTYLLIKLNY